MIGGFAVMRNPGRARRPHVAGKVVKGRYVDSITLMRIADETRRLPGVISATLVLATPANRRLLRDAGVWPANAEGAGVDDLVISVSAQSAEAAEAAVARADALLTPPPGDPAAAPAVAPRSITSATRWTAGAALAVVAVPGRYAVAEAHEALAAGLHVFLFSDGVALADEVALKRRARDAGRLVMGPECGTGIIGGIGVGFANVVRRGPIGLIGASGTGLQEVTTLAHRLGGGVSHAIGTGGRDLQAAVGGITTLQALELLAADADTRVIVLVSKPADDAVAAAVLETAAAVGKPVVACLLGWRGQVPAGVRDVGTLEAAAVAALEAAGGRPRRLPSPPRPTCRGARPARQGGVHGLYTGGTLCEEARRIVGPAGARFVDFGGAEYTEGRPHPMIDPDLRNRAIAEVGDDASAAVLLLDFVLGHCAHPDPVGAAAPAIARTRRRRRDLAVVAHVVGTDDDPQRLGAQERALRDLGVVVCASNRLAAETARALSGRRA
jgi:FdrA protein